MSPQTALIVNTQPSMHLGTDVDVVYCYGGDGLAPNLSVTIPASLRDLRSSLAAVNGNIGAERIALYLCCAGQQLPSARVICKLTLSGTMPDHEAGRTQGREKGRPEGDAAEAQRRRLPVRAEPRVSITRPVLSKPLKPLPYNRLRFNTSL